MLRLIGSIAVSLLLLAPASAQTGGGSPAAAQQQSFVPIVIEQSDMTNLQQFFDHNTPPAYSGPIVQWLNQLEQKAQAEAAAKKKAETEKKTEK